MNKEALDYDGQRFHLKSPDSPPRTTHHLIAEEENDRGGDLLDLPYDIGGNYQPSAYMCPFLHCRAEPSSCLHCGGGGGVHDYQSIKLLLYTISHWNHKAPTSTNLRYTSQDPYIHWHRSWRALSVSWQHTPLTSCIYKCIEEGLPLSFNMYTFHPYTTCLGDPTFKPRERGLWAWSFLLSFFLTSQTRIFFLICLVCNFMYGDLLWMRPPLILNVLSSSLIYALCNKITQLSNATTLNKVQLVNYMSLGREDLTDLVFS